jgi:hypothetical protein
MTRNRCDRATFLLGSSSGQRPLKVLPSLGSSQFPQLHVIMVFEVGTPVADAPVTD